MNATDTTNARTERGTVRTIKRPGAFQTCDNHGKRVVREVECWADNFEAGRCVYLGMAMVNGAVVEVSSSDLMNWFTDPNSDYTRRNFKRLS
jgi:hypothetical protein